MSLLSPSWFERDWIILRIKNKRALTQQVKAISNIENFRLSSKLASLSTNSANQGIFYSFKPDEVFGLHHEFGCSRILRTYDNLVFVWKKICWSTQYLTEFRTIFMSQNEFDAVKNAERLWKCEMFGRFYGPLAPLEIRKHLVCQISFILVIPSIDTTFLENAKSLVGNREDHRFKTELMIFEPQN